MSNLTTSEFANVNEIANNNVCERNISNIEVFCIKDNNFETKDGIVPLQSYKGNGIIEVIDNQIRGTYKEENNSYYLILDLPRDKNKKNGMTMSFSINGWESIRYVAVGYLVAGEFIHIKLSNLIQGESLIVNLGHSDLIYGLQNNWKLLEPAYINVIKIQVAGKSSKTSKTSTIILNWVTRWFEGKLDCTSKYHSNPQLFETLKEYFKQNYGNTHDDAKTYLLTGNLPVTSNVRLDWSFDAIYPKKFQNNKSYSYIWHSMRLMSSLIIHGKETGSLEGIFAARDLLSDWLANSFFKPDKDKKFTWYDHGTAERLLSLIFMHQIGIDYNFDTRFMSRLRFAMIKHVQLLESEVFYSYYQETRYHNHAWFQDISLIAASVLIDGRLGKRLLSTALKRLNDQSQHLLIKDMNYLISIENSCGYHAVMEKLLKFIAKLISLKLNEDFDIAAPKSKELKLQGNSVSLLLRNQHNLEPLPKYLDCPQEAPSGPIAASMQALRIYLNQEIKKWDQMAEESQKWTKYLCYPNYRYPTNGDTYQKREGKYFSRGKPYNNDQIGLKLFKKAGYVIFKNNYDSLPLMLIIMGSNICKTHKHEDNLALTLFFDGVEWLTDPSFFSYNTDAISTYLRGASAHSSIFIPDLAYSLNTNLVQLDVLKQSSDWQIKGTHKCYRDTIVQRDINILAGNFKLVSHDKIENLQEAEAYTVFHFGENVKISKSGLDYFTVSHPKSNYNLSITFKNHKYLIATGMKGEKFKSIIGKEFEEAVDSISLFILHNKNQLYWELSFIPTQV